MFFEGLPSAAGKRWADDRATARKDDVLATPEGAQLVELFARIANPKVRKNVVALVRAVVGERLRDAGVA